MVIDRSVVLFVSDVI